MKDVVLCLASEAARCLLEALDIVFSAFSLGFLVFLVLSACLSSS